MTPNDPSKPERRPDPLIVEAWKDGRKTLKRVIGDAITAIVVVGCATVVGYVVRFAPGATKERLQLFDAYHFYTIFGLSGFFTLLLVTEVAVEFIRGIRRKDSSDA